MSVKGLIDLNRKFTLLPLVQKRLIHDALQKNATELTALQRRLVVVRKKGRRRGALKRSIKQKFLDPLKLQVTAGNRKKKQHLNTAFYVRFVEFGTRPGKRGRKITIGGRKRIQYRNHPGSRAQPFFYPAYRSLRRRMRGRLTRSITKAARQVTGRK